MARSIQDHQTIPLGRLPSLQAGPHQWQDLPIGIFDLHAMAGLEGVEGFLSLTCFRDRPLTTTYDLPNSRMIFSRTAV